MMRCRVCFCITVLVVALTRVTSARAAHISNFYPLHDTAAVHALWQHFRGAGQPPRGDFHFLIVSSHRDSADSQLIFLRNGTEVGRDNASKFSSLISAHIAASRRSAAANAYFRLTPYRSIPDIFQNYSAGLYHSHMQELGAWIPGVILTYGFDPNGVNIAWYIKDDIRIEWLHKRGNLYFGADAYLTRYHGSLARAFNEPTEKEDERQFNWALKAGIPFVRIELHSRTAHMPDLLWLDDRMDEVVEMRNGIITHAHVGDESAIGGRKRYFYTVIRACMGNLRYAMHIDPRAFRHALHSLWIADIRTGCMLWGAGMTFTSNIAAPGATLSLNPLSFVAGKKAGKPLTIEMMPLTLDASILGLRQWHFSLRSAVRLPDPFSKKGFDNEQ